MFVPLLLNNKTSKPLGNCLIFEGFIIAYSITNNNSRDSQSMIQYLYAKEHGIEFMEML